MKLLVLLLLLLLLTTLISVANSSSDVQEKQLRNIVDALLGGGDFANWANFLSTTKPLALPLSATLFIPSNAALSDLNPVTAAGISVDPLLVAYHIVPQHLTFSDLQKLPLHSRIPTLLSSNSIIVTNNSLLNFTVDDSVITHPDMFNSSGFSVHGVSKVLDYKVHGSGNVTQEEDGVVSQGDMRAPTPPPARRARPQQNRNNSRPVLQDNNGNLGHVYGAAPASSASDVAMILLVVGIVCTIIFNL